MSITVNLSVFSKKENSTARPTTSTPYEGNIKETCNMINPVISFNLAQITPAFNYAYIPSFSRYYYVNWTYENGFWVMNGTVDVLASAKDQIGASSQYIVRSSEQSDGYIMDATYPSTGHVSYINKDIGETGMSLDGAYVLGVMSKTADLNTIGAVSYYVMTAFQLSQLLAVMLGSGSYAGIDWSALKDITTELWKTFFNPTQYIVSCMWYPFKPLALTAGSIDFGWWDSGINAGKLEFSTWYTQISVSLPKHPQAETRGQYLNLAPYSRYTLNWLPFGSIELDTTMLLNVDNILITVEVDLVTGMGVLGVKAGNAYINYVHTQVGVPVQLGQVSQDYAHAASNTVGAVQGISSMFFQGNTGGMIGNATTGVVSIADALTPKTSILGVAGSRIDYRYNSNLLCEFFSVAEESNTHLGRPLCQEKTINSLGGYMVVYSPDISVPFTLEEQQRIKSYMEGGFFFE